MREELQAQERFPCLDRWGTHTEIKSHKAVGSCPEGSQFPSDTKSNYHHAMGMLGINALIQPPYKKSDTQAGLCAFEGICF